MFRYVYFPGVPQIILFSRIPHAHESLRQGYLISFIWGPDYRIEILKGAKGVGGHLSEGPIKLEIKFKCTFSSKIN